MELRRGRYLKSYEHPEPMVAGQPTEIAVPLRSHDHVFLKGHRLMVQVQSTWFPLIDRNRRSSCRASTPPRRRISSPRRSASTPRAKRASHIVLPVVR